SLLYATCSKCLACCGPSAREPRLRNAPCPLGEAVRFHSNSVAPSITHAWTSSRERRSSMGGAMLQNRGWETGKLKTKSLIRSQKAFASENEGIRNIPASICRACLAMELDSYCAQRYCRIGDNALSHKII